MRSSYKSTLKIKVHKVRDHYYLTIRSRSAAHSICSLKYNGRNKISIVVHNGPNHDYHFIIKELTNKFGG